MTMPTLETPENWDAAAQAYTDLVASTMMQPFAEPTLDLLDPPADGRGLEVAAGSGALTEAFHKRVASLLATDFSPAMIALLDARLEALGVTNTETAVMDGQDLALEDDSFDCAAALFGIMLFPDRARGFSELARVVRPGGRVAVTNWTGPDRSEAFQVLMTPMKAAFPDMPPPPAPPPVFSLSDPEVFRAEMEAAGLTDVKIDAVERGMEVPDVDVAWSMFTTGAPPARALMGQIGEDGSGKLRAALEVHVSERWGDGPIRLKNTALVGTGTVA